RLGWIDTLLPLVVPAFFGTAYFVFMFRQFFAQIPSSLLEAARILGASEIAIWWRIMLPACRPVIALTALFSFSATWNDFLLPLIYLHRNEKMTLAVALNSFKNQYGNVTDVHLLMAAAVVTLIPCIAFFFVARRSFGRSLSLPTIKG
ncbi:MAG: carbohydrate ABC transporter permease, partial [bacterium]|nr:carbohydrate ABC transporter permease [bacterium]